MKFRYWLTIGFIFSSLSCWAADNEAYIDQLGDYSTIYVEQDGSANKLIGVYGPSMPSNPSKIYGDGINVDIRQVGSGNFLRFSINSKTDSNSITYRDRPSCTETNCNQIDTGNTFIYYVNGYGSISSINVNADGKQETAGISLYVNEEGDFNKTNLGITGLRNQFIVIDKGDQNSFTGLSSNRDNYVYSVVTGSKNSLQSTQSGTMGTIYYNVSGNLNIASVTQEDGGVLGHYSKIEVSGNSNTIAVEQKGLSNDTIVDLKTTGSNNNFNIKSNSK